MPLLGTIASSKLTAVAGDFELISKTTVPNTTTTVTLSSIPQTYKHLRLFCVGLNNNSGDYLGVQVRPNGNSTSTNYSEHYLQTNYSDTNTYSGGGNNSDWDYFYTASTNNSNRVGLNVMTFYDYTSTSKNKSFINVGHFLNAGASTSTGQGFGYINTGNWKQNTAISSIELVHNSGATFRTGSVIWLYGITG